MEYKSFEEEEEEDIFYAFPPHNISVGHGHTQIIYAPTHTIVMMRQINVWKWLAKIRPRSTYFSTIVFGILQFTIIVMKRVEL